MQNNKMNKKIFIVVILFILVFSFTNRFIKVYANTDSQNEAKKICNATVEDNFTDDTILVTLTKSASLKFSDYSIKDFPNLDLVSVTELTKEISENVKNKIDNVTAISDTLHYENSEIEKFRSTLVLKLSYPSKPTVIDYIHILEKREDVYSAEPNYIGEFTSTYSNDPFINGQWAMDDLELPETWDMVTGGSTIRVGIIDLGIDRTHPDLVNRVNKELSRDFTRNNNPWADGDNIHGTHVAGIIGAEGNNSTGVLGVNWDIELVSLKVGDINATSEAVTEAILYAHNNDIKIINLSMSGKEESTAMTDAINLYNGIIICSSGNSGDDNVGYPARLDNPKIISVGSLESDGSRSAFSCWGKVDIWAPGGNILSTIPTSFCLEHNIVFADGTRLCEFKEIDRNILYELVGSDRLTWEEIVNNFEEIFDASPYQYKSSPHQEIGYHYMGGTSMAAPYVTGIVALLSSIYPSLTTQELRESVLNSAETISITVSNGTTQNVKKLNAFSAVKYVLKNYSSPISINDNGESLSKTVDSTSTFFNDKNYFLKLNIENTNEYKVTISSTSELIVSLYDSNFKKINISLTSTNAGSTKEFSHTLYSGIYYLKTNYFSTTASGTITVSFHTHSYSIQYYNHKGHKLTCDCGKIIGESQPHMILQSEIVNGRYATCLGCGYLLDLKFDMALITGLYSTSITQVSINGSYILPSGIIVLVDEDLDAYLNGTLIFYNKDELPVTQ
ncbi:MAG: S8 family serine peptidase [Roseburia sp.]|nr:S8 family serine peptidase [Anaeroplasma bactoclasticum]MCM1195946.1 S8 family serine peptidase [Roseburia sp.]